MAEPTHVADIADYGRSGPPSTASTRSSIWRPRPGRGHLAQLWSLRTAREVLGYEPQDSPPLSDAT